MSLISLQLFKSLSDETRLGIVLLLREMGELCVCDLCAALDQSSYSPRAPVIWRCFGKVGFCLIANRASGSTYYIARTKERYER